MSKEKYCLHCWPTKRKNHFSLHFDYYLNKLFKPFVFLGEHEYIWKQLLSLFSLLKIVRFEKNPDESKIYNRSLIFLKEAQVRGLDISIVKVLGNYTNDFKFIYQGKQYHYEGIPTNIKQVDYRVDDKNYIKGILESQQMPIPQGRLFKNTKSALKFSKELGFPLVVKPNSGSLSHHITCNINSELDLKKAIRLVKQYSPEFIVEGYITGNLYRATVLGRQKVFICQKEKANVIGNGQDSIRKLIEEKNKSELRGQLHQKNTTLYEIPIDQTLNNNLKSQNLFLEDVLPRDKKVYLQNKYVLSHGCDIINHHNVHPDNINLFIRVAEILDIDLVGIDFISPNIAESYKNQPTAILETNTLPYIDMHAFPSDGQSEPVAELVWDFVLQSLNK